MCVMEVRYPALKSSASLSVSDELASDALLSVSLFFSFQLLISRAFHGTTSSSFSPPACLSDTSIFPTSTASRFSLFSRAVLAVSTVLDNPVFGFGNPWVASNPS